MSTVSTLLQPIDYEEESEDGKTMSDPFFKKWLMDPNQRIYRNHREKNKDKLAPYMTNYMEGYYDDRKDKFYEYKKKSREKEFICTCGCQIKWY